MLLRKGKLREGPQEGRDSGPDQRATAGEAQRARHRVPSTQVVKLSPGDREECCEIREQQAKRRSHQPSLENRAAQPSAWEPEFGTGRADPDPKRAGAPAPGLAGLLRVLQTADRELGEEPEESGSTESRCGC